MDGNKNKVSLQRRKQREGTGKSKRNISEKHSMQSVWNSEETPKWKQTSKYIKYVKSMKEKQFNNG